MVSKGSGRRRRAAGCKASAAASISPWPRETAERVEIGTYKAVLFAKLCWSNQDPDREKRKQPAPDANHAQRGMIVYQSTKEKFAAGYVDFDRIVYCAAIARNYSAMNAAGAH